MSSRHVHASIPAIPLVVVVVAVVAVVVVVVVVVAAPVVVVVAAAVVVSTACWRTGSDSPHRRGVTRRLRVIGHVWRTRRLDMSIADICRQSAHCRVGDGPASSTLTFRPTLRRTDPVVKVVMCSRGGSAFEVETHKNIDSVLHTKTTFQAHSIFSVSIQK